VIKIYNILGENIYQTILYSNTTEINLSAQPQGMYLYRVMKGDGSLVGEGKVIIDK
jgi:hypothetical protein